MEGQILGNRYELIEKIGGGGMALVYKAKCQLLNRYVAVKILRPEFTNDEEFVKRFRIEAQSAASLSHPNIVSIYDVGHDDDVHYIIMEYIDGITLKDYITQKGALGWKEAVNICIQISSAIETAHRNHIVHRDIKPHNILLTREGIAKVTDFGIARAVSSSTITMVGSTIGSVHYFSPEQARGGFTDEKSDLYSLGIALFEMVTGRVPFDGESHVAIALKHIQDEAMQPVEIDASIPRGVNDIIVKSIKKEPNKRYQTASEFLGDLYRVLKEPLGGFVTESTIESSPTRRVQTISEENLSRKDEYLIKDNEIDTKKAKKKDKLTYWLAGITSVIIMVIFIIIGYKIVMPNLIGDVSNDGFKMRYYVGQSIETAKSELAAEGFEKIKIIEAADDNVEKGIIISQNPEKDLELNPDGIYNIEFVVSKGPDLIKVPDLKGDDPREAERDLKDIGLEYKEELEYSETIAEGRITRSTPGKDEEVQRGEAVTVYVSKGPEERFTKVPNLVGRTQKEATKLLLDAKLAIGKSFPEDGSNFIDKIVKQEPAAYTEIKEGQAVDIYYEADTSNEIKEVAYSINLADPELYKDVIKVLVEITPSSTNAPEKIIDGDKNKTDFPLNLLIPVPGGGSTKVRIYLDGKPYIPEFTMSSTGR